MDGGGGTSGGAGGDALTQSKTDDLFGTGGGSFLKGLLGKDLGRFGKVCRGLTRPGMNPSLAVVAAGTMSFCCGPTTRKDSKDKFHHRCDDEAALSLACLRNACI